MDQTIERRIETQRAEDVARLADKAEREGVRVLLTADGEHFATSRSNPTALHRVGVDRCDCRGWLVWGRCGHNALLQSQLGLVPDPESDSEPEPEDTNNVNILHQMVPANILSNVKEVPTARCPSCAGKGFYFTRVEGVSQPYSMTCSPCHGTGQVKARLVVGDLALRPVA